MGVAGLLAWLDARRKAAVPQITVQATKSNQELADACPVLQKVYHPTPFLTNGHAETILAAWFR